MKNVDQILAQYTPQRLAELNAMAREVGLPDWEAFLLEQAWKNPEGHGRYCGPTCTKNHGA